MIPENKPHICFVADSKVTLDLLMGNTASKVGGAEVQQTILASALAGIGYPISFIVPDCGQAAKVVTREGIALIKTRKPRGIRGLHFPDEIARLYGAMKLADADIYYQRTGCALTGIAGLVCSLLRKPFVFSIASNMDLDGISSRELKPHYRLLYHRALRGADAIVAQTDDQVVLLKKLWDRDSSLIRSTFSRPVGEPIGQEYVLWVGNFREVKRPEMFLELASRIPERKFVMVGGPRTGEEPLFKEIKSRAQAIPNLEVTGAVPYSEVGSYFSKAIILVNTSSAEGFPNTYVQAWCRGVPVVGIFDADSLISRYGLGRRCGTLDELMAAVREFVENEALCREASERCLAYVEEHHSPDAVAAEYDRLFMSLRRNCRR